METKEEIKKRLPSIGLAPLEGVTCFATRLWFSQTACPDFAMTPFFRVTQGYQWKRVPQTYAPEVLYSGKNPFLNYRLVPQLMGTDPADLSRIAEHLLRMTEWVDFNCGCPSPNAVGKYAGSGLLEQSDRFAGFLAALQGHLGAKKFSIKMRSGFFNDGEFPLLLDILKAHSPACLTLHARTRQDRYRGLARWELIAHAAASCPFPVVGSGDLVDFSSFKQRLHCAPAVRQVIIGRGALRNPWIFQELKQGQAVSLLPCLLPVVLACFALLQDLEQDSPETLFFLLQEGIFFQECGMRQDRWFSLYHCLVRARSGQFTPVEALAVSRVAFARVKMLWGYLRSSLPEPFFEPLLLRTASFSEFSALLQHIIARNSDPVTLMHQEKWDFIYSGEKKNEQTGKTTDGQALGRER